MLRKGGIVINNLNEEKLTKFEHIGETGKIKLWQEFPDNMQRIVPDVFLPGKNNNNINDVFMDE
ncbi:MAG: hypothetical protein J6A01_12565 [Proteobacteria bacterium]|nr:hypothetical protein [Pseudomonadota bacterium]